MLKPTVTPSILLGNFPSVSQAIHYFQLVVQPHQLYIWSRKQMTTHLGQVMWSVHMLQPLAVGPM